jgi:polar amino acid transport system substrate-binding protein
LAVAAIVVLVAAPWSPARAADGVLRVSFNDLPPWKVLGPKGEPAGIDIEFLEMLAARMGLAVEYVHYPFKRGLKMMEVGEIDLMVGVLRRAEREAYLHYIEPPYKSETSKAFFVLRGRERAIAAHDDLRGLRVGTVLGGRYYPEFDDDPRIVKYAVTSPDLNFKMLLAGRIDAFVMTETAGDYRVARSGLADRIAKADYVHRESQDVYMVLSRRSTHAARLGEFNRVMAGLVSEGSFDRARDTFIGSAAGE